MNFVTIKLQIEEDESKDEALLNFHTNISKLLDSEIDYAPQGVLEADLKQVFVGLQLKDNDMKDLLDASPGNTFEIIDAHWPQFLKNKTAEGAQTFDLKDMDEPSLPSVDD